MGDKSRKSVSIGFPIANPVRKVIKVAKMTKRAYRAYKVVKKGRGRVKRLVEQLKYIEQLLQLTISDEEIDSMWFHECSPDGVSILDHLLDPLWSLCARHCRKSLSPKRIMLVNFALLNVGAFIVMSYKNKIPEAVLYIACLQQLVYQMLNAVTFKHASKFYENHLPMYELLDIGCSGFANVYGTLEFAHILGMKQEATSHLIFALSVMHMYHMMHMKSYLTGRMHYRRISITEVQMLLIICYLWTAKRGLKIWATPLYLPNYERLVRPRRIISDATLGVAVCDSALLLFHFIRHRVTVWREYVDAVLPSMVMLSCPIGIYTLSSLSQRRIGLPYLLLTHSLVHIKYLMILKIGHLSEMGIRRFDHILLIWLLPLLDVMYSKRSFITHKRLYTFLAFIGGLDCFYFLSRAVAKMKDQFEYRRRPDSSLSRLSKSRRSIKSSSKSLFKPEDDE